MARVRHSQPLLPPVLDRLLDNNPGVTHEAPAGRHQLLHELIAAVRRDLENLLNTRVRCLAVPDRCRELKQSLVNYGIPDISAANLNSAQDRDEFCQLLQTVIRQYEPRFKTVTVTPVASADPHDRTFHLRIGALLIAEPAPEPIVFDSMLQAATGAFQVKEADE